MEGGKERVGREEGKESGDMDRDRQVRQRRTQDNDRISHWEPERV